MWLIWFVLGLLVGAVFGAKHQTLTIYFYQRVKPTIKRWKATLAKKIGGWFKKQ